MSKLLGEADAYDEPLAKAVANVVDVAGELMDQDPDIRSVGVGRGPEGKYEYVALRLNRPGPVARFNAQPPTRLPRSLAGTSIRVEPLAQGPKRLATVLAGAALLIPEQGLKPKLVCGLRIQNVDHDVHTGKTATGRVTVGTLGCFVKLGDGRIALLSNNHVIAGENCPTSPGERVLQPSDVSFNPTLYVATVTAFKDLKTSPISASVKAGTATLNDVDAAVAALEPTQTWSQSYLPARSLGPLLGTDLPVHGDDVYMVGSQSGDRYGSVTTVATVVGPISYGIGNCWFRRSIVVTGKGGKPFAAAGDSGAVVVRVSDNKVLGLLYSAGGAQAWACPIDEVFAALSCSFA